MTEIKKKLNEFFTKYIDNHIISDIKNLEVTNDDHKTSYPYLSLSFSGIDFFGGLEKGFKRDNSRKRFIWFLKNWMGKVFILYKENSLAELIYDSCRNGIIHTAILKNSFTVSSYFFDENKHLYIDQQKDLIIFHSLRFSKDFIKAQSLYRKNINDCIDEDYLNRIYGNISKMIEENRKKKTDKIWHKDFSQKLVSEERVYSASITTKTSSETTMTEPPEHW
jgi:hypothetical protein